MKSPAQRAAEELAAKVKNGMLDRLCDRAEDDDTDYGTAPPPPVLSDEEYDALPRLAQTQLKADIVLFDVAPTVFKQLRRVGPASPGSNR